MNAPSRRPKEPPEDGIAIRVVVAAAVEVALFAVVMQGGVDGASAVAGLVLAPLAYFFSYRQRARSKVVTKVLLSVGLLAAFAQFLGTVRLAGTVDDARVPLGSLFVWVQVLHAFDVPRRRDLAFSMVSSLILMAQAASLSLTTSFALFLLPWCALAGVWLHLSSRPRPGAIAQPILVRRAAPGRARVLAPVRALSVAGLAVVTTSTLAFMSMPRLPGSFVQTPPFSLGSASRLSGFDGSVENPGLPAKAGNGVVDFAPGAYPGFGDVVDLRSRGRLSDEIAFRVRTSQPSLWRAEIFDLYGGSTWTISESATRSLDAVGDGRAQAVPADVVRTNIGVAPTERLVQTFYIDTPQPNVLFAAPEAREVFFPSGGLRIDEAGSIRAPILLDEGLVYSVISEVPVRTPALLRSVSVADVADVAGLASVGDRYLQLPEALPARVGELADRITAGAATEHDRVVAVQSWLRRNTRYDLGVPREPDGADAVDHFLFVTRRGFCEHIASAMAVLLRSVGVPTRLVTGFGPGERNSLTGYMEVRQADAHAWVEVFYPAIGWVAYDPTFGVPEASSSLADRFMAGEIIAAAGRFLGRVIPGPVKEAFRAIGRVVVAAGRGAARFIPLALGLAVGAILAAWALGRRIRRRRAEPPPRGAAKAFSDLVDALAVRGLVRASHQTPSEFLEGIGGDATLAKDMREAAELVVRTFEHDRFSASPPSDEDVARALDAAARVRELTGRR